MVINPDVLGVTRAMGQVMATGRVPTLVTMPVRLPEPTKVALGINGAYETPPKSEFFSRSIPVVTKTLPCRREKDREFSAIRVVESIRDPRQGHSRGASAHDKSCCVMEGY